MNLHIRVTATREDIAAAMPVLDAVLDVVEASEFYPNRGASRLGRVYLNVVGLRTDVVRGTAQRADQEPAAIGQRREGGELS